MTKQKVLQGLKTFTLVLIDSIIIGVVYTMSFFMYKVIKPNISFNTYLLFIPVIIVFKLIIYYLFGFYKVLTKHISFEDTFKTSLVVIFTNIIVIIALAIYDKYTLHIAFYFFITAAEITLILVPRIIGKLSRIVKLSFPLGYTEGISTIIIGAGSAGELALREIHRFDKPRNNVVGFLDDDFRKIGKRLMGVPIRGSLAEVEKFVDLYKVDEVVIAIQKLAQVEIQKLVDVLASKNIKIKRLYPIDDINNKMVIRDVKIEDLLNRDEIILNNSLLADFIQNEIVLVTGGGGSIGSELCRQIANLNPQKLIIFDIYENNAYDIEMELTNKLKNRLAVYIGSVYNKIRLEEVFNIEKPTIVFHAAAYKHVPLMENNSIEAIRTNIVGTHYLTEISCKYKVKKFVLVSSDKAVRPTNMMGATKRFAELIITNKKNTETSFSAVRFGNVLGSNGSVVPLFKKQIESGGPVTLTDEKVIRYFMTIEEAVSLILQSAVYAKGGEIFVLDMGEPVLIKDLAEKMIRLSGYEPYRDIDIKVIGLRPGEKLYEELLVDPNMSHKKTDNKKIFIEENGSDNNIDIENIILKLDNLTNEEAKALVKLYIKSYQ